MSDSTVTKTPKLDVSTFLSVERTRVAYDRTMLAWVRTATALITFGFTIYKLFQVDKLAGPAGPGEHLIGPREFALTMISIGLVSLLLAAVGNRQNVNMLKQQYPETPRSMAAALAGVIALLGILALIAVILRR